MSYILLAENDTRFKRHECKDLALQEAERLCRKERMRFMVYECIGEVRSKESPIEFIEHKTSAA